MKVLVIGGGGYIGHRLVRLLRREVDVVSAGRHTGPYVDERVDLRYASEVGRLLARTKPDVIVVTAYMLAAASDADPVRAVETNILGMTNVFQAAASGAVRRIVFASSGTVHSGFEEPLDELASCRPTTLYGRMKLFNEWTAQHYNERFGAEIVAYRISGPHGRRLPHQYTSQVPYDTLVAGVRSGGRIRLPWSGGARFRFIHVEDAAASFRPLVLSDTLAHRVYNSPGISISVEEMAAAAEAISGVRCEFTEPGEPLNFVCWDSTRYETEFGFQPRSVREWMRDDLADGSIV